MFIKLRTLATPVVVALLSAVMASPCSAQRLSSSQRNDLKEQADQAYRAGNYVEAERLCTQVLASDEKDHVALYLRGSARVESGVARNDVNAIRNGINDARAAIGIETDVDYYLPYLFGMANLARIENRPEHATSAQVVADQVLQTPKITASQKANVRYQRALIDMQLGDNVTAQKDLAAALEAKPDHLAAHMAMCDLTTRVGTPAQAEAAFSRAITASPEHPLPYNNRGMFLQTRGRYDEAIRDFDKAISLNASYVPAWTNRGFTKLQKKDPAGAEADLTRSLQLNPQQPEALGIRAGCRVQQGKIQEAISDYQTAVGLAPTNPATHYNLGFAYFFDRNYTAAREAFDKAREMNASLDFLAPWRYTAIVFSGDREQASKEFGHLTEKVEAERTWFDVLTLYLMGEIDEKVVMSSVNRTEPHVEKAQECEAYYFIGLRHASQNRPKQAAENFQKAIETEQILLSAYRGAKYALGEFNR